MARYGGSVTDEAALLANESNRRTNGMHLEAINEDEDDDFDRDSNGRIHTGCSENVDSK
eukprot:CAMPEP_0176359098 /NCGR_PEP_ID=MMETSP0126-20121128/16059_1 /TAXON_ID=141414 ORGANISM="Strombidinopsis acuminatum, Strain SPMC142" /NCGR_SAMPLE_ID=MMETSP0126 /ASSEMBLY_ACC=CAM_ASM_000229 /LENGTH=58 /DNA_ID=CAMNT_0017713617 /DNA_START=1766 /DNA_END=1942 /DNA_ORIENTATION=+